MLLFTLDHSKNLNGRKHTITTLGEAGPIKQQNVPPPVNLIATEHHFTFVRWAGPNTFAVNWMNRYSSC